tara:strand:- start:3714 stop:4892 length:1179 start_codon:yes stop_codon:yes gene_type:complete
MGGSEILSTEMVDGAQSKPPNEEEKLEVPNEISPIVSETGEEGGTDPVEEKVVDSEEDIEQLEAEMRELEAKVAQKKAALKTSKEEARIEQLAVEKAKEEAEKERQSEDAEEAIKKAEEKVEVAKAEVEEAIKKAEKEEAEAEEARLIADLEEDEAKEAKEDAETAKRNLDEAVREAELAGMNVEQITEDAEKMKREMVIIERIRQRSDTIDWTHIGSAEGVKPDDLTRINGIDEFTQKKLNALGLVTFEQLSKIDANITETVNDALEFVPGRVAEMEWTKQAITMIGLEGVDSVSHKQGDLDETGIADLSAAKINWAQIGKAGDRKSDDLTKIKGIDLEIEKKLKVLGIRTFDQISKMDKDTSEAVNGALGLMSGRVTKMMWVQQAVALIE